jgi:hypothetical protein
MPKLLAELIREVLDELGASDGHPVHRSEFNPIIESRWIRLGNILDPNADFGQAISAELHRFSSDSSTWQKARKKQLDLFKMHGDGYWSVRDEAWRGSLALARLNI